MSWVLMNFNVCHRAQVLERETQSYNLILAGTMNNTRHKLVRSREIAALPAQIMPLLWSVTKAVANSRDYTSESLVIDAHRLQISLSAPK